ncbi:hypothetical protein WJ0W_006340 [Paenibacillus melissococcoides]|uniref:Uncharacterized protein n=1 Tax=Paenibacillus melissococcoides TaxID=2912268 RepID=A0ABN8UDC9_9BACL|nr:MULTISPECIES: hypothetical protein [Paenibacillus]MEB9897973.1 hypothetical protein [Bacillus cereus]GIO82846.1 hypothetical protein J6TS7_64560 [Paenibacillus dendritiformis]CAH8249154.1 hypothetical protein WJ0W_006340 [Paenibacillus melissococcoides]
MKKKILASIVATSLLTSAFAPTLIFAESLSPISQSQLEEAQSRMIKTTATGGIELDQKFIDETNILNDYITKGPDGLLHIDPKAREKVSNYSYILIENGINILNESLKSNKTIIQNNLVIANPNATDNNSVQLRSAFANTYWWGVAITMNQRDTELFAYQMKQFKEGFATEAAIAGVIGGIIGGPAAWSASAAGAIMALGYSLVANSLEAHNNPNGVTLNIHWLPLPYYEVTENSKKPY